MLATPHSRKTHFHVYLSAHEITTSLMLTSLSIDDGGDINDVELEEIIRNKNRQGRLCRQTFTNVSMGRCPIHHHFCHHHHDITNNDPRWSTRSLPPSFSRAQEKRPLTLWSLFLQTTKHLFVVVHAQFVKQLLQEPIYICFDCFIDWLIVDE